MRQVDYDTGYILRDLREGRISSNTTIKKLGRDYVVFLFGHPIARYNGKRLKIDTCGFYTLTTVNRLNGILTVIADGRIKRKCGKLFLDGKEWNGREKTIKL